MDILTIRKDFPVLEQSVYGKKLLYFDNAATTQVPEQVLACLVNHYHFYNGNVHRGIHYLSERSTEQMENARKKILRFLHGEQSGQLVFTSGTTEAIDFVAKGYVKPLLKSGDAILVTDQEHHSNFLPWQQLCKESGAEFRILKSRDGCLDMEQLGKLLDEKVKLVSIAAVTNLTGAVADIQTIIKKAHAYDIPVLLDGAQAIRHLDINLKEWDCDFFAFSGHKMLAPTGIGGLYVKNRWIDQIHPVRYGGGMVDRVSDFDCTVPQNHRILEAGTPNYAGAIALGAAVDYMEQIGIGDIRVYETDLTVKLEHVLRETEGVHILGHPKERTGVISFAADGVHPYDLASVLDKYGVAIRSGELCAQPALRSLGLTHAARISPAFYNTIEEVEVFGNILQQALAFLRKKGRGL